MCNNTGSFAMIDSMFTVRLERVRTRETISISSVRADNVPAYKPACPTATTDEQGN
ncbi:MAG: hypothetical protein ACNYPE_11475 [Candidatus Azotimanducaceae bacterium WSBS_2022_MAG_OTU7]